MRVLDDRTVKEIVDEVRMDRHEDLRVKRTKSWHDSIKNAVRAGERAAVERIVAVCDPEGPSLPRGLMTNPEIIAATRAWRSAKEWADDVEQSDGREEAWKRCILPAIDDNKSSIHSIGLSLKDAIEDGSDQIRGVRDNAAHCRDKLAEAGVKLQETTRMIQTLMSRVRAIELNHPIWRSLMTAQNLEATNSEHHHAEDGAESGSG